MSDPYGALAMQRKGDVGFFDGSQWQPTSYGMNVDPITKKTTLKHSSTDTNDPNSATRAAVTGGTVLTINEGSVAHPVTTQGAALYVSRYANMSTAGDSNAAIFASSYNNGTTQPVGVYALVTQDGAGDSVGFYANVHNNTGSHAAFGFFCDVMATVAGGGAIAMETSTSNSTGANVAYTAGAILAFDLNYRDSTTGTHYAGAAIQIRSSLSHATEQWDAGIYVPGDMIRSYVVDASLAVSATSWHGKFTIDNEVQITRAIGSAYFERFVTTGGGSKNYGITIANTAASNDSWGIDEVGVAQKFYIIPGTPGANTTCLVIQEGAGPTSRRLKTFDPGAAGINFTAGQLVCVLV